MSDHVIKHITFFDPAKIARSGQAFRIHKLDEKHTELVAYGRYLQISDLGNCDFAFSCTEEEFNSLWSDYFNLDLDYISVINSIDEADTYLKEASDFGYGIRILRQEFFETTMSYIISQRKSIPSIMTSVERICSLYGTKIEIPESVYKNSCFIKPLKEEYYSFPTPQDLINVTSIDYKEIGVGYRALYLELAVQDFLSGRIDLDKMVNFNDEDCFSSLTSMKGVGKKVANCILLFSLHRTGAFPIDVWIERILNRYYNGSFDTGRYPDTAGIMQQFMFFYERNR